ncbi:MAG: serine/threonine-protein phosphatase [Acidobacteriota bacterium]|nr:serine/threonine-protein phosphatase [Acidobacteriota bacterium]
MKANARTRLFYESLSPRSRATLDGAIFCLFAPVGIAMGLQGAGDHSWLSLVLLIVMSGGVAVLYGRAGFTGRVGLYMTAGLIVQLALIAVLRWLRKEGGTLEGPLSASDVRHWRDHLRFNALLLIAFIAAGYGLFVSLFTREGARYWTTTAEIRLAQRIHQRLVPAIDGRGAHAEWAGVSTASGDIGGDLVDIVEGPAGIVGCVADVSGHGVGAGLLMGMFKTAFRTSVARLSDPAELLAEIHIALAPLTEPNMFVTAGVMRVSAGSLQFAGGGHPPMLLYRKATGRVEEIASTGPAIALLDDFSCSAVDTPFEQGDVALLLTDGILEALDAGQQEVGLEPVSRILAAHAAAPLTDLVARISALAAVGTRVDDQTVLAVRAV